LPMTVSKGFVNTTLGTVSVTVDGQNAPMLYVSQNQISIQIPYEVQVKAARPVVITYGSSTANSTVDVQATAPGIFTANGTGTGQAAALNYDSTTQLYTLNSGTNLAKIGELICLYLTGEGIYNTPPLSGGPSDTGYMVPDNLTPLPQVNPAPTVTIGGQVADVTNPAFYAGPIPGSMLGLLQINAVVPTGATTGAAVPVVVSIGGNASPAGVTLAIHP
jgi:trimeric autotransporter adhesin